MRWLLVKDLQILRRSPLLVGTLVVYPIAIALMIGFALSSPPGKPTIALYSGVPKGHGQIKLGSQSIDVSKYAAELYSSVQAIHAPSPAAAVADVRDGRAEAALIIPADIVGQIESLLKSGVGSPTVQLVLNTESPLERQFAQSAIQSRINLVEQAVSRQVLKVAVGDLREVLNGGTISFLGQTYSLLGLRNTRTIVEGAIVDLGHDPRIVPALRQVVNFANLAIGGLTFASPVLGSIDMPLTVQQTQLSGRTTPTATYAVAIAVVLSLMFVALLLAAAMLALERSEHAYPRLVRGPLRPEAVLGEKVVLAAGSAVAVAFALSAVVSIFVPLEWSRVELWLAALALAGLAFGALGAALGALAREIGTASLLALLLSLPIAFIALIPSSAVSGGLGTALDVISFVFPFRAGLEAISNAFSGTAPGIGLPLAHLAGLGLVLAAVARMSLGRFASG